MINTHLDHIVIGAATLDQGIRFIENRLGVSVPAGGEHAHMGTHNRVTKLGNGAYLEIIAIDPKANAPTHPRWFGLDNPYIRSGLRQQPQLLTWVVNIQDISVLQQVNYIESRTTVKMSRGKFEWLIAIPQDGNLPGAGLLPTVIQWQTDTHPSETMTDLDCSLLKLEIHHANHIWLTTLLSHIGAERLIEIHSLPENVNSYMVARIQTPLGIREISSYSGECSSI